MRGFRGTHGSPNTICLPPPCFVLKSIGRALAFGASARQRHGLSLRRGTVRDSLPPILYVRACFCCQSPSKLGCSRTKTTWRVPYLRRQVPFCTCRLCLSLFLSAAVPSLCCCCRRTSVCVARLCPTLSLIVYWSLQSSSLGACDLSFQKK